MQKTSSSNSILNFEYKVVERLFRSDHGRVFVECKTKKEMMEKLYPILKKHLFFCAFDKVEFHRIGEKVNDKKLIARIGLKYHNRDFCEFQITQVLKRIKLGKITKSSTVEKSLRTITSWGEK